MRLFCVFLIALLDSEGVALVLDAGRSHFSSNSCRKCERPSNYRRQNNSLQMVLREPDLGFTIKRKEISDTSTIGTLKVPSVGIGTISWSSDSLRKIENENVKELISTACNADAAFFDTAERYGGNMKAALGLGWGETEKLTKRYIDEAIRENGLPRVKPVVATKFTPSPWRTTAKSVVEACEQSIQRLGVDKIDLYQLHMPDIVQPLSAFGLESTKDEIYWDGLAECYERGLVSNVGVCNYGPTLVTRCHEALAKRGIPLASNQIGYSLIGRHSGSQETLDTCNALGIKVMAFFPFAMGLLTGKYSTETNTNLQTKNTSLTANKKTSLEVRDLKKYIEGDGESLPKGGIEPLIKVLDTIAIRRNKTIAQIALNYIVCKGAIPIPGARTSEQVTDNIGAMGWRLSPTEVAMLELEADGLGIGFEGAGFKRTSEKFVGYGVEKWQLD